MLKVMRNSFGNLKWVLVAIILVFVLSIFIDFGAGGSTGQTSTDAFAARVNGQTVSVRDYERSLFYAEKNYEQMYRQPLTEEMRTQLGLPTQVMSALVDQTLLLQEAERLNLSATPEEVRKRILELPVLSPDGKFVGPELYERYVTGSLGYSSAAAFEEDIRRELTLGKMEGAMQSAVVVSSKAAEEEFRRAGENTKIRYILYPASRSTAAVTVTPADISNYYKAHLDRYTHAEQRDVKYLLADHARIRSLVSIDDATLERQYAAAREDYKTGEAVRAQHILIKPAGATPADDAAARSRAQGLLARLRGGADFSALAKENSGDPSSAAQGGDLGFFERGQMVGEFDRVSFSLPQGQISDLVKTEYGYHIIRVNEKRGAGYRPLEEVKAQLRTQLVEQTTKDQARQVVNQTHGLLQQSKPKSDADLRAYSTDKISLNDTRWFGKSDTQIPGIGSNSAVMSWTFAAKVGDVGPIIGTSRGPIIPYLAAIRPAGVSPVEEVTAKVEADVRQERAAAASRDTLAAAMPALSLEALGLKLGLSPGEGTITGDGFVTGFSGNVQSLVEAAKTAAPGKLVGPVQLAEGAVVFEVTEQVKPDPTIFAKNKGLYISSLREREAGKIRSALLARLRKQAKVTTNERLVNPKTATTDAPS
ncbi:MAG TPA: peptidyl-prolyl cis-trans isomerase [Thermoanaerobaculia bacterium]|nr:peptidyl-prolyl cis-trans isomerase [Thermoanaerobaculia bacterium]